MLLEQHHSPTNCSKFQICLNNNLLDNNTVVELEICEVQIKDLLWFRSKVFQFKKELIFDASLVGLIPQ